MKIKSYQIFISAFIIFLAVISLGFSLKFPTTNENIYALEKFEDYEEKLLELTENYQDDYSNRLIVKADRTLTCENAVFSVTGYGGLNIFQFSSHYQAREAMSKFNSYSFVEYTTFDSEISLLEETESEPADIEVKAGSTNLSWGRSLLGIDEFQGRILKKYGSIASAPSVYVAVLDTGIDTDHEFFTGRVALNLGKAFVNSALSTGYAFEDDHSHGTHVSGTVVDLTQTNVKVIPIKIFSNEGRGSAATMLSAIEYTIGLKNSGTNVACLNMSLSGPGSVPQIESAIKNALDANILTVTAAGNSNYYVEEEYPANITLALTISALSQNSYYSKFPYLAEYSNYGSYVDLCLPGSRILSAIPGGGYGYKNGTSMATPHAAALVALYSTFKGGSYDAKEAEQTLKKSTYDFGDKGRDDFYGEGVPSMALIVKDYTLSSLPTLSVGNLGGTYNFSSTSISVTINNTNPSHSGYNYKIYYSTDGSLPTLSTYTNYSNALTINKSTLLRFVIYIFDANGYCSGRSDIYEATYYKGSSSLNDDGTGFTINTLGTITAYNSGLRDIVIPSTINGITVKKINSNVFFGLEVESIVCNQNISLGDYPFSCLITLKSLTLASSSSNLVVRYCPGLKNLSLPNLSNIEPAEKISNYENGYYGSATFLACFNLRDVNLPKVKEVPLASFSKFKRLEKLALDYENLTTIANYAFDYTESLAIEMLIEGSLTQVGSNAFYESGITGFYGRNVAKVSDSAFKNCKKLKFIELPSITTLAQTVLYGANSLSYIMIGKNVSSISSSALSTLSTQKFNVYCYSKTPLSSYTSQNLILINPALQANDDETINIEASLIGYDLTLELYKYYTSEANKTLVDSRSFPRISENQSYIYDKINNEDAHYILKITDFYGLTVTLKFDRLFAENIINVKFYGDDGKLILSTSVAKGEPAVYNGQIPTKASTAQFDYTFIGWKIDGRGELFSSNNLPIIDEDTSFTASFSQTTRKYLVSWYDGDNRLIYSGQVAYGTTPTYDENEGIPQKSADKCYTYSFAGFTVHEIIGETRFYAEFEPIYIDYTVEYYYGYDYDASGTINDQGDKISSFTCHYDDILTEKDFVHSYTSNGNIYTFTNWNYDLSGKTLEDFDNSIIEKTLKVSGVYGSERIDYLISWLNWDDKIIYQQSYHYGDTPVYNKEGYGLPSRESTERVVYNFKGWNKKLSDVTESTSYKAEFDESERLYKISWLNGEGGVFATDYVPYEGIATYDIQAHGIPTKNQSEYYHYKFLNYEGAPWSVTSEKSFTPLFKEFHNVKNIDATHAEMDLASLMNVNTAKIDVSQLDGQRSLKIKFFKFDVLISAKNILHLKSRCSNEILISVYEDTSAKFDKNDFPNAFAFKIEGKMDNKIATLAGSLEIKVKHLYDMENNVSAWGINNNELTRLSGKFSESSLTFEAPSFGSYIIGNEKPSYTWIIVIGITGVVVLIFIIATPIVLKRRKMKLFEEEF